MITVSKCIWQHLPMSLFKISCWIWYKWNINFNYSPNACLTYGLMVAFCHGYNINKNDSAWILVITFKILCSLHSVVSSMILKGSLTSAHFQKLRTKSSCISLNLMKIVIVFYFNGNYFLKDFYAKWVSDVSWSLIVSTQTMETIYKTTLYLLHKNNEKLVLHWL